MRLQLGAVLLSLTIVVAGCAPNYMHAPEQRVAAKLEQQFDAVDTIVSARVIGIVAEQLQDNHAPSPAAPPESVVYTDVKLSVLSVLKGPLQRRDIITVRLVSPYVDSQQNKSRYFSCAEEVYLLLEKWPHLEGEGDHFVWALWNEGKYVVTSNGTLIHHGQRIPKREFVSIATGK